jgi:hypothetical protein
MRHLISQSFGQDGMAARFEPGEAKAEVVRQETREGAHLGHDKEPARTEHGEDLGEDAIGIRHVVQGRGRPHQVNGIDGGPRTVQIRLDGGDPVGHAEGAGPDHQVLQQLRNLWAACDPSRRRA